MTLEELHKIINKPESECDGFELHLHYRWKTNNAKAIFEITGLHVYHLLNDPFTQDGTVMTGIKL